MRFITTIRGIEIEVHAEEFDYDPSVGIEFGPIDVYAKTLGGEPFELTNEEAEKLGTEAAEIALNDSPDC